MKEFIHRLEEHKLYVISELATRDLIIGRDYLVEGVYLQGSQNYNAHTEHSDVDSKMILIPTVRSLIRGTKLLWDMDIPCADGSVEKCSIKPYKEYEALFFKGNFNNLEILFTDYYVGGCSLTGVLRERREELVKVIWPGLVSACLGMQNQKKSGLYKSTEGTKAFFDQHGYDNKNLTHIIRIAETVKEYERSGCFATSLKVHEVIKDLFTFVRNGGIKKEYVDSMVESAISAVEALRNEMSENKAIDKMHKQLPKLKDEIGEITAQRIEDILKES